MDLQSAFQAVMTGSQAGDAMAQGMIPNSGQPRGSPQLYIKAADQITNEVAQLNTIYSDLYREAGTDEVMQKAAMDLVGCIHKIQGISTTLSSRAKEMVTDQATQGMSQPQQPQQPQQAPMY